MYHWMRQNMDLKIAFEVGASWGHCEILLNPIPFWIVRKLCNVVSVKSLNPVTIKM